MFGAAWDSGAAVGASGVLVLGVAAEEEEDGEEEEVEVEEAEGARGPSLHFLKP